MRIKSCAPPWLTNDIRYKMNERFKLFKVAMANRCPEAWSAYHERAHNSVTRATIGEKLNNLLPPPVTTHPVPDGPALGEVPQLSEFHLSEIAVKR